MTEPMGPKGRTLNWSSEDEEENIPTTVRDRSAPLNWQTNTHIDRHDDPQRDSDTNSLFSVGSPRLRISVARKNPRIYSASVEPRSSAMETEFAVTPDVHHESLVDWDDSSLAIGEHERFVHSAFQSADYHHPQSFTPWRDPREWATDDGGLEELFSRPVERDRSLFPILRTSCGQQRQSRTGKPSGSTIPATKRLISYREQADENSSDFPVDHDYQAEDRQAEESLQVLRRSRRKTRQPSRYVTNQVLKHHQAGSAETAAPSPISRDLPQAQHSLLYFTNPAYGKVTVDLLPLGPCRPASITSIGQCYTHPKPASPPGTKRRRVITDSNPSSPEGLISLNSTGRGKERWDHFHFDTPSELRDFPWEVTSSSLHEEGHKVHQVFFKGDRFSLFASDTNDAVFLSQLIPKKYDEATRKQFLWIFSNQANYVPACVIEVNAWDHLPTIWYTKEEIIEETILIPNFKHPLGSSGMGWPTKQGGEHPRALPAEIFLLIGQYLPRDSVQNMRLVNREFEKKISRLAFRSVVVPFKPQIYGAAMPADDCQGKGKAKEANPGEEHALIEREVFEKNYDPKESHVKDGMRVFEQWGPEIQKFALTFEVTEDSLKGLVPKKKYVYHTSFWGTYKWPPVHYSRFEHAAELEEKADESSVMTTAFSKLKGIQEFGLSMISGLGWQTGPDISDRAKLFNAKPAIFGPQYSVPDRPFRDNLKKWEKIVAEQTRISKEIIAQTYYSRYYFAVARKLPTDAFLPQVSFKNQTPKIGEIPPPIMFGNVNMESHEAIARKVLQDDSESDGDARANRTYPYTVGRPNTRLAATSWLGPIFTAPDPKIETNGLCPAYMTVEQDEWLMEMEWAQCAFLSSWCLAVLDNPGVFHGLRTFTVGSLSSGLLGSLQRDDIWHALPNLANLTVLVLPDWRRVSKDVQGNIKSRWIKPSRAQELFETFLSSLFKTNCSIRTLKVGYIGGGEKAPGMYARNKNVLPAPIMRFRRPRAGVAIEDTLYLPNVEHLILSNCWLTPDATKTFFAKMEATELKTVKFESISLTADPDAHYDEESIGPVGMSDQAIAARRNKWLNEDPVFGSWSEVVDIITPGLGIDHARYAHGKGEEKPLPPDPTTIESITFDSCGYVRLPAMNTANLNQNTVAPLFPKQPECLKTRYVELERMMLSDRLVDDLLGTIVPSMMDEEEGCLNAVWGMVMGWGDKEERWHAREDGQGIGGMGRFEGVVRKM